MQKIESSLYYFADENARLLMRAAIQIHVHSKLFPKTKTVGSLDPTVQNSSRQ